MGKKDDILAVALFIDPFTVYDLSTRYGEDPINYRRTIKDLVREGFLHQLKAPGDRKIYYSMNPNTKVNEGISRLWIRGKTVSMLEIAKNITITSEAGLAIAKYIAKLLDYEARLYNALNSSDMDPVATFSVITTDLENDIDIFKLQRHMNTVRTEMELTIDSLRMLSEDTRLKDSHRLYRFVAHDPDLPSMQEITDSLYERIEEYEREA